MVCVKHVYRILHIKNYQTILNYTYIFLKFWCNYCHHKIIRMKTRSMKNRSMCFVIMKRTSTNDGTKSLFFKVTAPTSYSIRMESPL